MNPERFLYVRLRGKIHGPLLDADLQVLARDAVIASATEVAATSDGPWIPLATLPSTLRVDASPARSFDRANQHGGPKIDLKDIIAAANRRPLAPVVATAPAVIKSAAHDVGSLLKLNNAVEAAHGLNALKPLLTRPSRRRRDYFLLMAGIGALIFVVLVAESFVAVQLQVLAAKMPEQLWPMFRQVLFHSPIMAWGLAAFCFYAVALGWIMFGVMDDY